MIETSVQQETLRERLVAAFMRGADEEMIEIRGYGLTKTERAETETEAHKIYSV